MERNILTLNYRWIVFALSLFYTVYTVIFGAFEDFGGPLRFLTIWGLLLSLCVSWHVLGVSRGVTTASWDVLISATAVVNAMVVFLY
ncbi:MAG: hypothetical protein ACPGRD_07720 [Planktomarina sp.]